MVNNKKEFKNSTRTNLPQGWEFEAPSAVSTFFDSKVTRLNVQSCEFISSTINKWHFGK